MAWLGQAHWLSQQNLLRALPGLRSPAQFFGHPPGLHVTFAAPAKLFGPSLMLAHLLIACFAALGVCATFLLARMWYGTRVGYFAAVFLLLSPLYLAQAGMFLADLPVAALGVLSVYLALTQRFRAYLVCASYMVVLKETAAALVLALVLSLCLRAGLSTRARLVGGLKYAAPLGVLGAFVLWQKLTTGHFFFIYTFPLELVVLSPDLVWRKFQLVTHWIFIAQHRYVFTALILLSLLTNAMARRRGELRLLLLIVVLSGYSFAAIFFLPRYLLPVLPFFYMLGAASLLGLVRRESMKIATGVGMIGFMLWSLAAQPFGGNGEYNMTYREVVRLHHLMTTHVAAQFPRARTLTVWPHTPELRMPILGYVASPLPVNSFTQPADLRQSDLILVSRPEAEQMAELRALAGANGWPLLKRFHQGALWVELYGRPPATGSGALE